MNQFPASFLLLQHEGYLFRSCLLAGLNALGHATASDPGNFYSAFFQLSVGTERLLKSIVIIDHMASSGQTPTNRHLRELGHDIKKLIRIVATMPATSAANPLVTFGPNSVEVEIIDFLAEFATTTRYYNLDALSQAGRANAPLKRWNVLLQRLVRENVSRERVLLIAQQSAELAGLMNDWAMVVAHDLDGTPMDMARMLAAPRLQELGCRYAVWHVVKILDGLHDCLHAATWRAHGNSQSDHAPTVPFMYEFLNFTGYEKRQVLRKKRWP